ncbi:MAG: hypothetical protein H6838_04330 [Planctomycetes bacterium]|nr:hypothetical protein [Planctomycetota bacterium]MCB9884693.1 hypothetical protein [Planctomycetota bacterium]
MRPFLPVLAALVASLQGCASGSTTTPDLSRWLAETPEAMPTRLWLAGDRIVRAAASLGPGAIPQAARTTIDSIAPSGTLLFQGREWGPGIDGFRVEKHYSDTNPEHSRSVLVTPEGRVLERAHTVPVTEVPRDVLATALRAAPQLEQAWIVSDDSQQRFWLCELRSRIGHQLVLEIALDGRLLGVRRRITARVDV